MSRKTFTKLELTPEEAEYEQLLEAFAEEHGRDPDGAQELHDFAVARVAGPSSNQVDSSIRRERASSDEAGNAVVPDNRLPSVVKYDIQTFDAYSGGDFREDGPRPTRAAKLVATLSWSWSPAHSSIESYWLFTDRKRLAWHMTITTSLDGTKLYAPAGSLCPWRGVAPKDAASELLLRLWMAEVKVDSAQGPGAEVLRPGLLDASDIRRIEERVFGSPLVR